MRQDRSEVSEATLRQLFPELDLITDARLRESVVAIWAELWELSEYQVLGDVPATMDVDYPQVKHCQGTLRAALAAASVWEDVHGVSIDRDVLIAGALLMDVGKLVEVRPDANGGIAPTAIGALLPHALYAAHLALAHDVPLPVVHIITTHSRNAGKAPSTLECRLLDWIDQADIAMFAGERWQRRVHHVAKH